MPKSKTALKGPAKVSQPLLAVLLLLTVATGIYLVYFSHASAAGPIVFTQGPADCSSSGIYTINGDGTAASGKLADGYSPSWSSDKTRIAYEDGQGNVYTMNRLGGDKKLAGQGYYPVWSKAGNKIAVARYSPGNDIYVISLDATGKPVGTTNVTKNASNTGVWGVSWLGESALAYSYYSYTSTTSTQGVAKVNADGTAKAILTNQLDMNPDWSPQGDKVAFTRFDQNGASIYTMSPSPGAPAAKMTNAVAGLSYPVTKANLLGSAYYAEQYGFKPTWSPDGKSILYPSTAILAKVPTDGGGKGGADCNWYKPSPVTVTSGAQYVYALVNGLSIVSRDGLINRPVYVSQPGDNNQEQKWSSDSTQIAFGCLCSNKLGIFTVGSTAGLPKRLNTQDASLSFDW